MKKSFFLFTYLFLGLALMAQGFNVDAEGEKTFSFKDQGGRNQATFFSTTPLEDITGTANGVDGSVTFDVKNITSSMSGTITVTVESMHTGIELRDEHLRSANWLNAEEYPEIKFEIKGIKDVKSTADNKLTGVVFGDFTMHGVTKEVSAPSQLTYLVENEKTKQRAEGDLLGVNSEFKIKLSEFGISNDVVGNKVAEEIEVKFNVIGSSK